VLVCSRRNENQTSGMEHIPITSPHTLYIRKFVTQHDRTCYSIQRSPDGPTQLLSKAAIATFSYFPYDSLEYYYTPSLHSSLQIPRNILYLFQATCLVCPFLQIRHVFHTTLQQTSFWYNQPQKCNTATRWLPPGSPQVKNIQGHRQEKTRKSSRS